LSYEAASHVAATIAIEVESAIKDRYVVVAGTELLADLANLVATRVTLEGIASDYRALAAHATVAAKTHASIAAASGAETMPGSNLVEGAIPIAAAIASSLSEAVPPLAAAAAAVQAGIGLVSLFRQNVNVHGVAVGVDALAFEIEMAAQLHRRGAARVYVSELLVFEVPRNDTKSLRGAIRHAQEARAKTWSELAPLVSHLANLEAAFDAAVAEGSQERVDLTIATIRDLRRMIDPIVAPLSKVDQRLDQLQAQFAASDSQSNGLTLLARLFRAESLKARDPLFVYVRVVASGEATELSTRSLATYSQEMDSAPSEASWSAGRCWILTEASHRVELRRIRMARRSRSRPRRPPCG
jgi:hypothetical protein